MEKISILSCVETEQIAYQKNTRNLPSDNHEQFEDFDWN